MQRGSRSRGFVVALTCCAALASCRRREHPEPDKLLDHDAPAPVKIFYPRTPGSFVSLHDDLAPSIVNLRTDVPVRGGPGDWMPIGDSTGGALLGDDVQRAAQSLGSGFLLRKDGLVVTNAHLIGKHEKLWVETSDRRSYPAEVVGSDGGLDLAILKVKQSEANGSFKPLRVAQADDVRIGEWVAVLANPFGTEVTLSAGVVSGTARKDLPPGTQSNLSLLRTDLTLHPGNTGGAVINSRGEAIGVAVAVEPAVPGIGFVLPMSLVERLLPGLERHGKVVRAWVGIYMDRVTAAQAEAAGLKDTRGALVTAVVAGGPAARAGLRKGDIIRAFAGKPVENHLELPWMAALAGVDRALAVDVIRDGKPQSLSLRTEAMPE